MGEEIPEEAPPEKRIEVEEERRREVKRATEPLAIMRLALELLKTEEKTAADREAKLSILKFLRSLEDGRTDEYIRGYREGYTQGYRDGVGARREEVSGEGGG